MKNFLVILLFSLLCKSPARAQDSSSYCHDLIAEGNQALYRFQPAEASSYYMEAIDLSQRLHYELFYAQSLLGEAQASWYLGHFKNAADTATLAVAHTTDQYVEDKAGALRILSNIYDDMGEYEKAFRCIEKTFIFFNKLQDNRNRILCLVQMGKLYQGIGDFAAAEEYYQKAWEQGPEEGDYPYRELNHRMGELYMEKGSYDTALLFYKNALKGNPHSRIIRQRFGEYFLLLHKTDIAYHYLQPLYEEAKQISDINAQLATMIGLGQIALDSNQREKALALADSSFIIAEQRGIMEYRTRSLQLLVSLYKDADPAKALYYQQFYDRLRDSSISDVFRGQLYTYKQRAQESAIHSLQTQKKIAWLIVAIIALLAALVVFTIIYKHKNERLRLRQRADALQMQALRAQMNPHFIFNCLSAINHFVLDNETATASEYLTRFSRLMRMVLANADKASISLEEEIETLQLYLEMEKLRFKDAFEYTITIEPGVDAFAIGIPSFTLQPFCENAIWHGLLHKKGKGKLTVQIKKANGYLVCTIEDNGVGITEASRRKSIATGKNESMGQKLGAGRLGIFNNDNGRQTAFSISELKDENNEPTGTLVTLKIKLKEIHDESHRGG